MEYSGLTLNTQTWQPNPVSKLQSHALAAHYPGATGVWVPIKKKQFSDKNWGFYSPGDDNFQGLRMNIKSFRIVFFLFFGQIFTFSHTLSHHQIIIFLLEYNFSVALNKIWFYRTVCPVLGFNLFYYYFMSVFLNILLCSQAMVSPLGFCTNLLLLACAFIYICCSSSPEWKYIPHQLIHWLAL